MLAASTTENPCITLIAISPLSPNGPASVKIAAQDPWPSIPREDGRDFDSPAIAGIEGAR
jgi:hypothetical protein